MEIKYYLPTLLPFDYGKKFKTNCITVRNQQHGFAMASKPSIKRTGKVSNDRNHKLIELR